MIDTEIRPIRQVQKAVGRWKKVWVQTGLIFDQAKTGVIVIRSRQIWYHSFGLRCVQTLLWPLSTTSTKKKVIPEKHDFRRPQKSTLSRVKRTRLMHASPKQLFSMHLWPIHNRAKFQPDRTTLKKVLSF